MSFLDSGLKIVHKNKFEGRLRQLVTSLDGLLLILKNLQLRNVFLGPEFDFQNLAILGEEIYLRRIEKLRVLPNCHKYSKEMLLVVLKKLRNPISEILKKLKFEAILSKNLRIIESAYQLVAQDAQINCLEDLIFYFRKNLDLDKFHAHKANKDKKGIKIGIGPRRRGFYTQNTLDMELVGGIGGGRKYKSWAKVSPWEVKDDGCSGLPELIHVQRAREIKFKNKFV